MPYIGNQYVDGYSSVPAKQDLTGATGGTLTLTHAVASSEAIDLYINNVRQEPTTSYSVAGTTVTLNGYTVAATDDIYVVYNALARQTSTHPSNQSLQATIGTFSGNVTSSGTITASSFSGDGSALTGVSAGKVLKMSISQITANSTRGSATSFADDLDFGSFTPSTSSSTVFIQGVANLDSSSNSYLHYRWVINGTNYFSTGGSTPTQTHAFYSSTSLNDTGYLPSTIMTSVANTDGSAITVKCQGSTSSGTLHINKSAAGNATGSPSSVIFMEVAN